MSLNFFKISSWILTVTKTFRDPSVWSKIVTEIFPRFNTVFEGAINSSSDYKNLAFKITIVHEISGYGYLKNWLLPSISPVSQYNIGLPCSKYPASMTSHTTST